MRHSLQHGCGACQTDEVRVEGMHILRKLARRVARRIHADEHHAQPRYHAGFDHLRQLQQRHRTHIGAVGITEVDQCRGALEARRGE